eukprot:6172689-Pleurochrysis_carterae.AAC.3
MRSTPPQSSIDLSDLWDALTATPRFQSEPREQLRASGRRAYPGYRKTSTRIASIMAALAKDSALSLIHISEPTRRTPI